MISELWLLIEKIHKEREEERKIRKSKVIIGLPLWLTWKRISLQFRRPGFNPCFEKIPRRREGPSTPVFWPGELHGLYSPWGGKESDVTFTFKVIIIIFVTFEFSDFIWICVLVTHSVECFLKDFY